MKKLFIAVFFILFAWHWAGADSAFTPKYKLGDEGQGGGIVFYVSEQGFEMVDGSGEVQTYHYLEVSKTDLTTDEEFVTWCPCTAASGWHSWSQKRVPGIIVYNGLSRFAGKWNTYDLCKSTSHPGGAVTSKNCAAQMCFLYTTESTQKGEWYLPSEIEMQLLYISAKYMMPSNILYNAMKDNRYWVFRPAVVLGDSATGKVVKFIDGSLEKNSTSQSQYSVRAIHAF